MKKKDNILLLGYGHTGNSALAGLNEKFNVLAVVTPEKGKNIYRNRELLPVEIFAKQKSIRIIQSNKISSIKDFLQKNNTKAVVISSYNKILPYDVLKLSKFINIHHGDLPKWRGRANINWAIIRGEKSITITFHEAIPELDGGNIFKKYKVTINKNDIIQAVYEKVNDIIKNNIAGIVEKVLNGYKGYKQEGLPSYCCTRLPEDGYIDWNQPTKQIHNLVRAVTKPYEGAFTYLDGKKLIIWDSEIPDTIKMFVGRIPGRIIGIHKGKGVEVLTQDSSIIIKNVTFENQETNASYLIKSVNKSLGLNIQTIYEFIKKKNECKI